MIPQKNPIKKITPEKVAVLHVCNQADQIAQLARTTEKLSVIITGNGKPEDGYVYKVVKIGKDIENIHTKLTGISATVKELYDESTTNKEVVKTNKEIKAEKRADTQKTLQLIATIVMVLAFIVSTYFSNKKQGETVTTIKKEIQNQEGVSKVTRGGYIKYNDRGLSDSIKIK